MSMTEGTTYPHNYIDGAWVTPASSDMVTLTSPATGKVTGQAVRSGSDDVDRAVAAARAAFPAFSRTTVKERLEYLERFAAECDDRKEQIMEAIMLDIGAPAIIARSMHADIGLAVINGIADALRDFEFETQQGSTLIVREPMGVAGLISAWNGPVIMFCGKVASALAAGCTIVYKPAELATHTAVVLAEALVATGLPDGVFNFVLGRGSVVGEALSTHPDVDYISFTGSTPVGARIAKNAADNFKKVALELGGKSAFIVLPDADVQTAAEAAVLSVMINSGQVCAAGTRTLVPRALEVEFLDAMSTALQNLAVGLPEGDAFIGPVVSEHQWETVERFIETGIDEGARVVAGGPGKPSGLEQGCYVKPTIFADVSNDMTIAREEIFGPVASVIAYDTVEAAVEIANDSPYGLSGYVFGADHERATEVARQLRTGNVHVNSLDHDVQAPWGGYKASGIGREAGEWGIDDMLEVKAILNYFPESFSPSPAAEALSAGAAAPGADAVGSQS